ncbi:hypothetical protein NKH89_09940 [Mesorhizobium sp. M0923]|uniref:hypothetical protein n=1 Tax=Mesorhizobium sp. M0923 TaxID=2957028 RepID=UPI0033377BB1
MAASQINTTDTVTGLSVAIATELIGGKHYLARMAVDATGALIDPATAAKQDAQTALLTAIGAYLDGLEGFTDGLEALLGTGNGTLAGLLAAFKAEDAVHVSGDLGLPALAIRKDVPGALGDDGDYTLLQTGSDGRLHAAVVNNQVTVVVANIANGASLTGGIDLGTARLCRIAMPAAWTAAVLSFQASYDGATYNDLYTAGGSEYIIQAAASRSILLPVSDFIGVRYVKIRSGTSAAAVAQAASRDLQAILVN